MSAEPNADKATLEGNISTLKRQMATSEMMYQQQVDTIKMSSPNTRLANKKRKGSGKNLFLTLLISRLSFVSVCKWVLHRT